MESNSKAELGLKQAFIQCLARTQRIEADVVPRIKARRTDSSMQAYFRYPLLGGLK